ncbi:MAG: hypothetical protein C0467_23325 [Planctomycetaceae bacterium]|nr:hypothetical protein [Planctomycetaceae bacterium]
MNPLMLVLAMSAGQGPVGAPPAVRPGTLPLSIPVAGLPGQPPTPMPMTEVKKVEEPKAEEPPAEEPPAAPVYLLERSLRETWLGKTMADNNLRVYGWTAMNYSVSTNSITNLPMTFNDQPQAYQMNQNWLHFEKAIDSSKDEFQWGLVTDWILPGTDSRFTIARGLFNGQTGNYQFDLYQAYLQAFLPNLGGKGTTVKVGKFSTHCEYEVVQAVDTPFVSKSYLFQYNPFTHTGVWATTQLNDTWSVSNGFATGSDTFIDPANRLTYLGQVKWAPPEGKTTALFNTVITRPDFDVAENFAFYNVYNAQVIHKFTDKFTYVIDATYSNMNNVPGVGASDWYGAANYFIYKLTDTITTTVRAEVFEDSEGVRTGFRGLYTEVTAGVAWSPKPGLIVRPSVRYDNNANSNAFEGKNDMWSAAFEMIFRW